MLIRNKSVALAEGASLAHCDHPPRTAWQSLDSSGRLRRVITSEPPKAMGRACGSTTKTSGGYFAVPSSRSGSTDKEPVSGRTAPEGRLSEIVGLVERHGFVSIEAMARQFNVTVQTIRRDLKILAAEGRVSRYRGGAGLPSSIDNMEYERRRLVHIEAKRRIAGCVAADVPDHASLFLNIGTTTEQVAHALLDHRDLRVITNNLNVARIFSENTCFRIVITGRHDTQSGRRHHGPGDLRHDRTVSSGCRDHRHIRDRPRRHTL